MAQEKSQRSYRRKAEKEPEEHIEETPAEKAEPEIYRYSREQAKPPILLIGILLVLILIIGGGLLVFLSQKPVGPGPGPEPNVTPPANQTPNVTNVTNVTLCDDACHYGRAIEQENLSDCRLIEEDRLEQECYYQLSQASLEACKELTDVAKKSSCVTSFAVAGKDLTLCDLITAGRDECRLAVDPCTNAADRTLCLALLNKNPSLCGNDTCLLNYSMSSRNSSACGMINETVMSKACMSAIKLTDKCTDLPTLAERDYCYQLYAIYSSDYLVCSQISSGSDYAVDCYSYFAALRGNIAICDIFQLNERWDCYTHYALTSGDLDGCRSVDPLATTHRFNCVFEYAKKYGNVAACDAIEQLSSRNTCYQGTTIYSNQNLNWTYCKDVINFDWRNKCFTEAAKLYNNISICDYTQDGYADEACIMAYEANKTG